MRISDWSSDVCSSDLVQHVGNPDHAKWYPQRQFDWVHLETQIRHCVHAELMVGLGLLLTQALGTSANPIVQTQLAELIRFRETCRAFMIAAERSEEHTSELQSLMRSSYAVSCV